MFRFFARIWQRLKPPTCPQCEALPGNDLCDECLPWWSTK